MERAAHALREAFGYAYDEIAGVLRLSQATTRQILSRARKRLSAERREPVEAAQHRRAGRGFRRRRAERRRHRLDHSPEQARHQLRYRSLCITNSSSAAGVASWWLAGPAAFPRSGGPSSRSASRGS
ncbi:sigma factor-like helix-turn-helix DNA-binding protein [Streptomyces sp. NPDC002550]